MDVHDEVELFFLAAGPAVGGREEVVDLLHTGIDLWVLITRTVATEVHLPPAKLLKGVEENSVTQTGRLRSFRGRGE